MEKAARLFVSAAVLPLFVVLFDVLVQAQAQDQSGFISIDCGLPANETYADPVTGINYISDAAFIETGVSKEIRGKDSYDQQYWHLRSFPNGKRNCYTLNVKRDQKYIIRANFFYGNYDNQNKAPEFDLYLGVSFWASVSNTNGPVYREMIHVVSTNRLRLCLVDKGNGLPIISSIELRPLPINLYKTLSSGESLVTLERRDMGSDYRGDVVRYNNGDIYDRIWEPNKFFDYPNWQNVKTTMPVNNSELFTDYSVPSSVMMTAATPLDPEGPLQYFYPNSYTNNSINNDPVSFYAYLYFAELQKLTSNQSRVINIFLSSLFFSPQSDIMRYTGTPTYLSTSYVELSEHREKPEVSSICFVRDKKSTLPPLINAIEFYEGITILDSQTQEEDVDAMMNIKSVYKLSTRNWQGDPCAPEAFIWDGIKCTQDAYNTSSIISLNLSSTELTGNISSYISNLKSLQVLDLSYNDLTGPVPDFVAGMQFLKVLNLTGNNLTGSIPTKLLQKSKRGTLSLSLDGNPYLCKQEVCNNSTKKKNKSPIVVGIAAGSLLIIIFATMAIFWHLRFRRNRRLGPLGETHSLRISYSEIAIVTDNFKTVIGEGGFGKVYLGRLGDAEVAVKMLSASSFQGHKEFQAEAELLMRVHHTNLISLIGYCDEDSNLGLVYEYMSRGNLGMHLSEGKENTLTWEQRLQIATDAAQGMDYLHRKCEPQMIHRDVKSSNILITQHFNGKVADFGLSRVSPLAGGHATTVVAGTPGYLDPEYFTTNKLNEKSDVYSFGIVLMEIVTCRPVIGTSPEDHIIQYVNKMISTGDISGIIDQRLKGDADVNSVWRVLELATTCVAQESTQRPNMYQVAMELEECLASIRINLGGEKATTSKLSMESGPEAR